MTIEPKYLVVRKLETDPTEAIPFDSLMDAARFYEKASQQWTNVYLCAVLLKVGDPYVPPTCPLKEYDCGDRRCRTHHAECAESSDDCWHECRHERVDTNGCCDNCGRPQSEWT